MVFCLSKGCNFEHLAAQNQANFNLFLKLSSISYLGVLQKTYIKQNSPVSQTSPPAPTYHRRQLL